MGSLLYYPKKDLRASQTAQASGCKIEGQRSDKCVCLGENGWATLTCAAHDVVGQVLRPV